MDGLKIAIVGYATPLVAPWDPDSCKNGLPGSEECVVYGSQELANRGYTVTVYMNPPSDSIWSKKESNPRWAHVDTWSDKENKHQYEVVMMWRRYDAHVGQLRGKQVYFWPHDSPPQVSPERLPLFPKFDGVYMLSRHHQRQFSAWPRMEHVPQHIAGNGVVASHFTQAATTKSNPYSIGYFSNYARGLIVLLMIWPKIRHRFPQATLDIYYGRETWNTISDQHMNFILSKIKQYANHGVTERGKIGHQELAVQMERISIWAYPCTEYGETFCITAVKAQMAGCIPVTTRIAALDETIHPDAPSVPHIHSEAGILAYRKVLIQTLKRAPDISAEERQTYIDYSQQFTWERCVDRWVAPWINTEYKL